MKRHCQIIWRTTQQIPQQSSAYRMILTIFGGPKMDSNPRIQWFLAFPVKHQCFYDGCPGISIPSLNILGTIASKLSQRGAQGSAQASYWILQCPKMGLPSHKQRWHPQASRGSRVVTWQKPPTRHRNAAALPSSPAWTPEASPIDVFTGSEVLARTCATSSGPEAP